MYLINRGNDALLEQVLAIMPPLSGGIKENPLVARLRMQSMTRASTRHSLEEAAGARAPESLAPRLNSKVDTSSSSGGSEGSSSEGDSD